MNTKETTSQNKERYSGDKLDKIFAGQTDLMKGYKRITELHYEKIFKTKIEIPDETWNGGEHNIHTKEGSYLIKQMIDAAIQELSEAEQTMKNWKTWKQTEVPTDVDHFKEEMVDALHFFVEALVLAGVSSEDLYELYFKKHAVNEFRQESQY
jgi:dimeric dUTPase (all-alpha-NTP-PPase superfamily)